MKMFAEPRLELRELVLRRAEPGDAAAVAAYFVRNREHLAPFSPLRPAPFFSEAYWDDALRQHDQLFREGRQVNCFLVRSSEGAVMGEINLSNFVRGAFQACYLGYSLDRSLQGQGVMTRAVESVVQYAFRELHLHRVMANYLPSNERSARLLARLSFVREGFAPNYQLIAGRWQDHVLTARTNPDWTALP
ncbi:MAG: Ribosomal-protein-alanine N-acetyltransferase [Myxococcaceae bacterium]|nr:Ribosomal-protein-alanine N-acetyltransferase [Myxococcaceae bacterium]